MTDFLSYPHEVQIEKITGLAHAALANWQLEGSHLKLIKYRENAVFRVDAPNGARYALRVHRLGYHSNTELRSELEWMTALGQDGLAVPSVIPANDGKLFIEFATSDLPVFQLDMLSWLEGEPIGAVGEDDHRSVEEMCAIYHEAGTIAARLHNQSESWNAPAGFSRHAWDEAGLIGPDPFWGRFLELPALAPHLDLMNRFIEKAGADLARIGKSKRVYGLIHADLVPENLLRRDDDLVLLDFDDAGYGWHLFEIATAVYFHFNSPNFQPIVDSMVAGYRSLRDLSDADLAQFDLFLALRGTTYLGWAATRSETQTAKELTPFFVELAAATVKRYLADR